MRQTPEDYIASHENWCMEQGYGTMYHDSMVHMKNLVSELTTANARIEELEEANKRKGSQGEDGRRDSVQ